MQPADKSVATDAHLRRVRALKAAFQRQLGHQPSTIVKMLRDHAAVTMARAEAAANDFNVTPNDFRALDSAARRARNEFEAVARGPRKSARADGLGLPPAKEARQSTKGSGAHLPTLAQLLGRRCG